METPRALDFHLRHLGIILAALLGLVDLNGTEPWPAISAEEWAWTAEFNDPTASAEVLRHEVEIEGRHLQGTTNRVFRRIRLNTPAALAELSTVTIAPPSQYQLRTLEARVVRPDGSVRLLTGKEVEIIKVKALPGVSLPQCRLAPPDLAPGVILDYRYELHATTLTNRHLQVMQEAWPVRRMSYRVRPHDAPGLSNMRWVGSHYPDFALRPDRDNAFVFEQTHLPAMPVEPFSSPGLGSRRAVLGYFAADPVHSAKDLWQRRSRYLHDLTMREASPTRAIRKAVATIVSAQDDAETKAEKIHDHCRSQIRNTGSDLAEGTELWRRRTDGHGTGTLVWRAGHGTAGEINTLFVALARAAGLDARLALVGNRARTAGIAEQLEPFSESDRLAVVRLNDQWVVTSPGATFLPFGVPPAANEGMPGLIAAKDEVLRFQVNDSPARLSARVRRARLQLKPDGTLTGAALVEYTGHCAAELRHQTTADAQVTPQQLVSADSRGWAKRTTGTKILLTQWDDVTKPVTAVIQLNIPAPTSGASTPGTLVLPASLWQVDEPALLDAEHRHTDIMFPSCRQESDEIIIAYPENLTPEDLPGPLLRSEHVWGHFERTVEINRDRREIKLQRLLSIEQPRHGLTAYPQLKSDFSAIARADQEMLVLRPQVHLASAPPAASAGL